MSERCTSKGFVLGVGTTVRGPDAQARLWCRSRAPEDVYNTRIRLSRVAPWLASFLKDEYAGLGPHGSGHLPGESWHQWKEAADVYGIVANRSAWDGSLQRSIVVLSKDLGLEHSLTRKEWDPKSRHWHIQLSKFETPLLRRGLIDSWKQLEHEMMRRFE